MFVKTRWEHFCSIREDNYGRSLAKINRLVAEARKDFPELKDEDIEVVVYGGVNFKGQIGVEFRATSIDAIKDYYIPISQLEYTLN